MNKRKALKTLWALPLAIVTATAAASGAASYPDKPIRLIVPFPPGSITDVVARALGDQMGQSLGQPFVVDNRAGANGVIGTHGAAQASADGYTIVIVGVTTAASNVSLFKKLPYHPVTDFVPIGGIADTPYLLVSSPNTPGDNVAELFSYGQQNPGKLTYGYGSGSAQVFGAKLAHMGGVDMVHVSYRGGPQALTDVMGNQVNMTFTDFANGYQQAKAGKVKMLGVSTTERFALAPEIPTLNETGAPGFDLTVWFGLMAPTGVPEPIVQKLADALNTALDKPELVARFNAQGLVPRKESPADFGAFVQSEISKWEQIVQEVGIEPQ